MNAPERVVEGTGDGRTDCCGSGESRGERFLLQREQRGVESAGRRRAEPVFMPLARDTPRYDTPIVARPLQEAGTWGRTRTPVVDTSSVNAQSSCIHAHPPVCQASGVVTHSSIVHLSLINYMKYQVREGFLHNIELYSYFRSSA